MLYGLIVGPSCICASRWMDASIPIADISTSHSVSGKMRRGGRIFAAEKQIYNITTVMQTTTFTALLTAAAVLALVFGVIAIAKVRSFSHHHYRITGDEVRNTNQTKDCIL